MSPSLTVTATSYLVCKRRLTRLLVWKERPLHLLETDEDIVSTMMMALIVTEVDLLMPSFLATIVITIDVSAPTFRPGNKTFDRTKWCLDNNLSRSFKMVMTRVDTSKLRIVIVCQCRTKYRWRMPADTGASLDVLLSNVQHSKKPVSWASSKMDGIRLPNFETLKLPEGATPNNRWKDEALEAHEWLGMATLGSQRYKSRSTCIVTYFISKGPSIH